MGWIPEMECVILQEREGMIDTVMMGSYMA